MNAQGKLMRNSHLIAIGIAAADLAAIPPVAATSSSAPTNLELFTAGMQAVERDYVHPVGPNLLTKDPLKWMLTRIDPHSGYVDEQEYRQAQVDIGGKFGGISIEISIQDGVPKVIAPIDGTPAAQAGIEPGDLILSVDGQSRSGMGPPKIIGAIRGAPTGAWTRTLSRGEREPFDFTLKRSIFHAQSVKSRLEPDGFGYARISQFIGDFPKDLKQVLEKLEREAGGHLKAFILDLQNDPGRLTSALYYTAGGRSIQDAGISPDIVVEAAKDEHVGNSIKLSESTISGTFSNPGPLGRTSAPNRAKPLVEKTVYSPPMKADLVERLRKRGSRQHFPISMEAPARANKANQPTNISEVFHERKHRYFRMDQSAKDKRTANPGDLPLRSLRPGRRFRRPEHRVCGAGRHSRVAPSGP
jgi:C-terminal processing protease CtpA/Prc